jgi:ribonuclease P protein component
MHLKRPQDFERVYTNGVRAGDAHLLIFALSNDLKWSRLGLSVSKKHGCAVRRNLKRRRMKEAFRLLQHELPLGLDLILVPRQRDDSSLVDYQASLTSIVGRLARRLHRNGQPNGEGTTT